MSQKQDNPQMRLKIQMSEEVAQGIYSNLALVNHTATEFTIDVMYVQPQQPKATVRSRIISSPQHTNRLLNALEQNVRRYEERFGPIDLVGPNPADQLLQ